MEVDLVTGQCIPITKTKWDSLSIPLQVCRVVQVVLGGGIGACTHRNDQTINESLNGVNRQPSKKFIFYRQPSKMQIDTVKKFRGISILLFFPISADRHGLLAPEESSSKLENQFPCSQKHSF